MLRTGHHVQWCPPYQLHQTCNRQSRKLGSQSRRRLFSELHGCGPQLGRDASRRHGIVSNVPTRSDVAVAIPGENSVFNAALGPGSAPRGLVPIHLERGGLCIDMELVNAAVSPAHGGDTKSHVDTCSGRQRASGRLSMVVRMHMHTTTCQPVPWPKEALSRLLDYLHAPSLCVTPSVQVQVQVCRQRRKPHHAQAPGPELPASRRARVLTAALSLSSRQSVVANSGSLSIGTSRAQGADSFFSRLGCSPLTLGRRPFLLSLALVAFILGYGLITLRLGNHPSTV